MKSTQDVLFVMAVASVEPIFNTGGGNEAVVADSQQHQQQPEQQAKGTFTVKAGLAQMLKGGIIMDVVNAQQARIAEEAGACAVMALEKVPADIRRDGGVARMADPKVSGRSLYNLMVWLGKFRHQAALIGKIFYPTNFSACVNEVKCFCTTEIARLLSSENFISS